jgi:hypothetical protein
MLQYLEINRFDLHLVPPIRLRRLSYAKTPTQCVNPANLPGSLNGCGLNNIVVIARRNFGKAYLIWVIYFLMGRINA